MDMVKSIWFLYLIIFAIDKNNADLTTMGIPLIVFLDTSRPAMLCGPRNR